MIFTIFVCLLYAAEAVQYHCGSMEFQPCKVDYTGRTRQGFRCPTTRGQGCLDRRAWCAIGSYYVENNQCNGSQNLMLDHCLWVEKIIKGTKYHVNIAEVDWTVAEEYCQSKGYNLVSFKDQEEYDDVIGFLKSMADETVVFLLQKDVEYHDSLAQRCWGMKSGSGINLYWTGLFHDKHTKSWNYTNGGYVNCAIKTLTQSLLEAIQKFNPRKHSGFIGILDRNYNFFLDEILDGYRSIDSKNRARILCKSGDKYRKWGGGTKRRNMGCMTGFKCSGHVPVCIAGPMFADSEVCDGKIDCSRGEDENEEYCHRISVNFPDQNRIAHFFPRKRSVQVARRMCERENLTLPSLHSKQDIEFLKSLPSLFAKSRETPDFLLNCEDWNQLNWKILLGVSRKAQIWDDGSPIGYLENEIFDLHSDSDVYLIFNSTVDGRIRALHEQKDDIFPVCQERGFQVLTVPAIVISACAGIHTYLWILPVLLLHVG